mgnify:CR=1 FL=1
MNFILDGVEVDLDDEDALRLAVEDRTARVLGKREVPATRHEQILYNLVTYFAIEAGALAAYQLTNPHEPANVGHIVQLAQELGDVVGLQLGLGPADVAVPERPTIIVPPGAANEGDEL